MILKGALLGHLKLGDRGFAHAAALTTWWALRGELLMVPAAAFVGVASVQSNAAFERYIGGVRKKLSCSRCQYRQTR
jgi:hypothetical protein